MQEISTSGSAGAPGSNPRGDPEADPTGVSQRQCSHHRRDQLSVETWWTLERLLPRGGLDDGRDFLGTTRIVAQSPATHEGQRDRSRASRAPPGRGQRSSGSAGPRPLPGSASVPGAPGGATAKEQRRRPQTRDRSPHGAQSSVPNAFRGTDQVLC